MFSRKFGKNFIFNKISNKSFSFLKPKETATSSTLGYILFGIGAGGLAYLGYTSGKANASYDKSLLLSGNVVERNIALQRTKDTMLYFCGGLAMTSSMIALMLRSPTIVRYSHNMWTMFLTLPAAIFFMYGMGSTPMNKTNNTTKHLYWLGFNAAIAFSMVPIISFSNLVTLRDAFLLTSGVFGGLGYVAYMSRDDAFLGMQGILGAGLGGLVAISIANMFLRSTGLFNIWLYGGLALFMAMVLYDAKQIQNRAKTSLYFDPMTQSLQIYLDFVNIFTRILFLLNSRKNK